MKETGGVFCKRCGLDDGVIGYWGEIVVSRARGGAQPSPLCPLSPTAPGDVIVVELMSGMLVFRHYVLCMAFFSLSLN